MWKSPASGAKPDQEKWKIEQYWTNLRATVKQRAAAGTIQADTGHSSKMIDHNHNITLLSYSDTKTLQGPKPVKKKPGTANCQQ